MIEMNTKPEVREPALFMRRGTAIQWLAGHGITEYTFRQMLVSGVIRAKRFGKRMLFSREQMRRDVIEVLQKD